MAETLHITQETKKEIYEEIIKQLHHIVDPQADIIANMANISAVLKQAFNFFWVGFYRVIGNELILGPFQGELACTRIQYNRGVCGSSWAQQTTIIVPDVENFPGHIACSAHSKSEIVIPVFQNNLVIAVLDIDSDRLNEFDQIDQLFLEEIVLLLSSK